MNMDHYIHVGEIMKESFVNDPCLKNNACG